MSSAQDRNLDALTAASQTKDRAWFTEQIAKFRPHLHVDLGQNEEAPDRLTQASIALNLLHRMFPRTSVSGIAVDKLLPKVQFVHPIASSNGIPPDATVVLAVGSATIPPAKQGWYVDNRGWTAYLSREAANAAPRLHPNPVGASYAAALGVQQVFNFAFKDAFPRAETVEKTWTHDLVTFEENREPNYEPKLPPALALDDVAIIGLGSIGQAFVDILARLPALGGEAWLIDHESTDEGNESRYVLSFPSNRGSTKVGISRDRLKAKSPLLRVVMNIPLRLQVTTPVVPMDEIPGQLLPYTPETSAPLFQQIPLLDYQAIRKISRPTPFHIAVSCVDSEQTRRDIQMGLHKTVLNAWTDTATNRMNYAVGRHFITGHKSCLACVHDPGRLAQELDDAQFAARVLGIGEAEARARIANSDQPFTPDDVAELAKKRPLTPDQIQQLTGKTLQEIVHDPACGLARIPGNDREPAAQVPHVPVLAACHLATQLILEILGDGRRVENLAILDALTLPNRHGREAARTKAPGCLCQDPAVQAEYRDLWPSEAS
jgi:hypothetical protein